MAACAGKALHKLTDRWFLAINDVDHEPEAARDTMRAIRIDQLTREGAIQIEAGEVESRHLAKLIQ